VVNRYRSLDRFWIGCVAEKVKNMPCGRKRKRKKIKKHKLKKRRKKMRHRKR